MMTRYIHKDREDDFTSAQRSHITWQVLLRTRYDDNNPDKARRPRPTPA